MANDIRVLIVDNSGNRACGASCGPAWSSARVLGQAKKQVKARFGDRVQVKYLDLSGDTGQELPPGVRSDMEHLPLLLINGEVRISGQFDIRMLLDAIEVETELKR